MFKKKANNNKKIDLHQETEQIRTKAGPNASLPDSANQEKSQINGENAQQEHISNGSRTPIFRKKVKSNLFSLEGMEKSDVAQPKIMNANAFSFEEQKVATSEIELCFNEFRKLKEAEPIIQEQHQPMQQLKSEQKPNKMTIRMQDVDLESQPQILEIEVDEQGGFSPELGYGRMEDYDDVNGDYEDQLIRKTLTKRNYDSLAKHGGVSLNKLKQNQAKDSFVQKLKKVNVNTIKKAISRDLYNKKLKLKEITDTLNEISQHGGNKKSEIEIKSKRLKALKEQFQKLEKVIEYIYYWGDKINEFSISGIEKDLAERQRRNNTFDMEDEQF